jgi:hypothetical protein
MAKETKDELKQIDYAILQTSLQTLKGVFTDKTLSNSKHPGIKLFLNSTDQTLEIIYQDTFGAIPLANVQFMQFTRKNDK